MIPKEYKKKLDNEKRNAKDGDKKDTRDENSMNFDMELLKISNPFIKKIKNKLNAKRGKLSNIVPVHYRTGTSL